MVSLLVHMYVLVGASLDMGWGPLFFPLLLPLSPTLSSPTAVHVHHLAAPAPISYSVSYTDFDGVVPLHYGGSLC